MRTILALAALGLGTLALAAQPEPKAQPKNSDAKPDAKAEPEKKYTSKEGKYSVHFPGTPKTTTKSAGMLELHIATTESDKERTSFAVIYSDMPADVVKGVAPATILENGEKGLATNFQAKVTKGTETKLKVGNKEYPAREVLAEKGDLHIRMLLTLADNRLYQVFVVGPKDAVTGKKADEFLKSFEITG